MTISPDTNVPRGQIFRITRGWGGVLTMWLALMKAGRRAI